MSTHVVILGAGFGGLELATRLSDSASDEIRLTLIDRNDSFSFGFSKLDVLLGRKTISEVLLPYDEIEKDGVEFRRERVISIDPDTRRVATERASYDADVLVVALGADYDFAATPGFAEEGLEYYTLAGAERLRDVLTDFHSGKVLVGILGHPFKCPPAPFEGAFLLHDRFVERGIRHAVEIRVIGPQSAPVPVTKEVSRNFLDALAERGIEYVPNQHIVELDTNGKEARLEGGGTAPYDLFIGVPVHRVPEVVARSGLAPDGWVQVNPDNLATQFPDVYALGDVAALPGAKAGVFAENAARIVAENITARLRGSEPEHRYEHDGTCYIEFGAGRSPRSRRISSAARSRPRGSSDHLRSSQPTSWSSQRPDESAGSVRRGQRETAPERAVSLREVSPENDLLWRAPDRAASDRLSLLPSDCDAGR